jgi:hypothetical protein
MSTTSTTVGGVTTVTAPVVQFLGQDVLAASAAGTVGFFGTTPVVQQTVSDLATVIAALKAYGLSK